MAKKAPKLHYLYDGKMQPLAEIHKKDKERRGRSKYVHKDESPNTFLMLNVEFSRCIDHYLYARFK